MVSPGWSPDTRRHLVTQVVWITDSVFAVGCTPNSDVIRQTWPNAFNTECAWWKDRGDHRYTDFLGGGWHEERWSVP